MNTQHAYKCPSITKLVVNYIGCRRSCAMVSVFMKPAGTSRARMLSLALHSPSVLAAWLNTGPPTPDPHLGSDSR